MMNQFLPALLLAGLSHGGRGDGFFNRSDFCHDVVSCLPQPYQQMAWRIRKLEGIARDCRQLGTPPACENAPASTADMQARLFEYMSEHIGPTMQVLSLLKTVQGAGAPPGGAVIEHEG